MDEGRARVTPTPPGLFRRRASRRALLVGSASLAAAGATAAVVGISVKSGSNGRSAAPGDAKDGPGEGSILPKNGDDLSKKPITDPMKRAAHLLRRAGFGGSLTEIEAFAKLSRDEAADRLLNYATVDNSALDARIAKAGFVLKLEDEAQQRGRVIQDMQRWWLTRMAYTARPLEERMTLIWHGLLTSQISKIGPLRARFLLVQNETLRANALGKYDDLVQAMSKDPAMLVYLDTVESTKDHPNENYARELCELFTMGEGNYTEQDVRESARAFTGWRMTDPPRPTPQQLEGLTEQQRRDLIQKLIAQFDPAYRFNARLHDTGQKTFLGQTGNWNGDDIVRIIMEQKATGRYITTRLWKEFAYDDPDPKIIDRLVKTWDSSGHSIKEVVRAILVSDEFYSERAYFGKMRSPIGLVVGLIRGLELENGFEAARGAGGPGGNLASYYVAMDQVLFEPPNVAGWTGGPAWLSSSTFFARVNFIDQLLFQRGGRPVAIASLAGVQSADDVVSQVANRLIDGVLPANGKSAVVAHVGAIRDAAERAATAVYLIAGSPEFQAV